MSGIPEPATDDPPRLTYRMAEVAELTGLGYDAVRKFVRDGVIPSLTVGNTLRVIPAWQVHAFAATGDWNHPDWRPAPPALEATA